MGLCGFGVSRFDVCNVLLIVAVLLVYSNAWRGCFVAGCLPIRCLFGFSFGIFG